MTVVMDYPQAWEFVKGPKLTDHDKRCSYRTTRRGILCDCHIINNEYARRAWSGQRDDNIRPVDHEVVSFTKTDLIFWIATALGALAALYAVSELLKGTS